MMIQVLLSQPPVTISLHAFGLRICFGTYIKLQEKLYLAFVAVYTKLAIFLYCIDWTVKEL